jgi:hypothetical protein
MLSRLLSAFLALALVATPAAADTDYFAKQPPSSSVKVRRSKSRTNAQAAAIWGLVGGGLVLGGTGAWFHLDSRDAADEVSANDPRLIGTWTPELQSTYDRAGSSGDKAIVFYSAGALELAGALVVAILTHPGDEEVVITPGQASLAGGFRW